MKVQSDKGNVSLLEKSRIQALLLSLQQERNDTSNQLISLQGDMKLLLGLNASDIFEPDFDESVLKQVDIASVPFVELNNRLAERPDLKIARTAMAEAQEKVNKQVKLPEGYTLKWTGDFENQQRATKRLAQVVPVSIAIIFVILFVLFGNARDAGLVLLNVPYVAVGGILALLITRFNFSISAGIGFIALFGICIQNGVIMISDIKGNLKAREPLSDAVKLSVKSRVRSVLMTASMAAIGLMPAALSHGIGSESQRPLAIVIIGGLIGATFFTLFVFPLMVEAFYRRMLYDKDGKLIQRRL